MKKSNLKLEDLRKDQVMATVVRKIHNLSPELSKDKLDYMIQMEIAEFVDNPWRPLNPTSVAHAGDTRFVGISRPRRAWLTFEPSNWEQQGYSALISVQEIEALKFSSTTQGDVKSPDDWVLGTHFLTLNVLDPSLSVDSQVLDLHIQINESTLRRNKFQPAKLNPSNDEVQTENGAPIYQNSIVTFGKKESFFILSDQMKQANAEGRLPLDVKQVRAYHQMLSDIRSTEFTPKQIPTTPGTETPVIQENRDKTSKVA